MPDDRTASEKEWFATGFMLAVETAEFLTACRPKILGRPMSAEELSEALRMAATGMGLQAEYEALQRRRNVGEGKSTRLCTDCPPEFYPTDETRCAFCPRRKPGAGARAELQRLRNAGV